MRAAPALLAAALSLAVACDGGGDGPPSFYCRSSTDCPTDMVCEFPVPGGCVGGQAGQCATPPPVTCDPQVVCSCEGATASVCVVAGYTLTTPARSVGPCEEDGGPVDSGLLTPVDGASEAGDGG
jgi:hypothetical protein